MHARFVVPFLAAVLLPLALLAQTESEVLRAQIRADVENDPRSAQMSEVELNSLIESLATQAEEDGTASQYLESHNTFDYSDQFPPPEAPSFLAQALHSPMTLALAFLLAILLCVALYIVRRRGTPAEMQSPDIDA